MAVPFSNTKLRVPQGFRNLLHILAREIMRDQPADMIEYSNELLQRLLRIRIQTGHDPVVDGIHIEDRYYNNYSFRDQEFDPNDHAVNDAATKIQAKYRGYNTRKHYLGEQEERKKQEEEKKLEAEEIDIDLDDPAVADAAVKIQAGFRGHLTRKGMTNNQMEDKSDEKKQEIHKSAEEEIDIDLEDPEVNAAAIKIQAQYKGYKTRKDMDTK